MYVIYDNITHQILSHYDAKNPDKWLWDGGFDENGVATDAHIFNSQPEAELAANHLIDVFRTNGETEIDFQFYKVRLVVRYQLIKDVRVETSKRSN